MKILVIGEEDSLRECMAKFGEQNEYKLTNSHLEARKSLADSSVVFDFLIEEDPSQLQVYTDCPVPVFLNTIKSSLAELGALPGKHVFGFNGLPSFMNRPTFEVALPNGEPNNVLGGICAKLGTAFEIVQDRPGMVTPRIVCMIINEAYCTIEDGTATAENIDIAMKLGTNYPFGPIEWSKKIGLKNVVDILDAVYKHTSSAGYLACELLRDEAKREI